jgi:hypothetical protein
MARKCTICSNENKNEINIAIVQGCSFRIIANQYSVSKAAIQRHAKNHLPSHIVQSEKANELKEAESIIDSIFRLETSSIRIQEQAEEQNDLKSALMAIREQARLIELRAKLLGKITSQEGSRTTINRIEKVDVKALLLDPNSRAAIELLASKTGGQKNK